MRFVSGFSYTREVEGGVMVKLNSYAREVFVAEDEIDYAMSRSGYRNPRLRTAHNIALGKMAGSYGYPTRERASA